MPFDPRDTQAAGGEVDLYAGDLADSEALRKFGARSIKKHVDARRGRSWDALREFELQDAQERIRALEGALELAIARILQLEGSVNPDKETTT